VGVAGVAGVVMPPSPSSSPSPPLPLPRTSLFAPLYSHELHLLIDGLLPEERLKALEEDAYRQGA
jgi:hypothetical protein